MHLGLEYYPTTHPRTLRVMLNHGCGGPLRVEMWTLEADDKTVEVSRYTAKEARYDRLLYWLGADMEAGSVVVDLPRLGPAVYWTTRGEYWIEDEPVDGLRDYLSECMR